MVPHLSNIPQAGLRAWQELRALFLHGEKNQSVGLVGILFSGKDDEMMLIQIICYFHPYLGKWSNLTNIFQVGWNHQLVHEWIKSMVHVSRNSSPMEHKKGRVQRL